MDKILEPTRKKALVFLIDKWSSSKGGIQTVNRELCKSCAQYLTMHIPTFKVICLVTDTDENEQKRVFDNYKVELLESEDTSNYKSHPRILEFMWHRKLNTLDVKHIIGHSKFTGLAALNLRQYFKNNPNFIYFFHMDAEQDELIKRLWIEDEKSFSKEKKIAAEQEVKFRVDFEQDLIKQANKVIAIGPKLASRASTILGGTGEEKLIQLVCGSKPTIHRAGQPDVPRFLVFGRTDNIYVKGLDIFAKAAGIFTKRWKEDGEQSNPTFVVLGAGEGNVKELEEKLIKKAESQSKPYNVLITAKPYTDKTIDIETQILQATAVAMPSRSEGFGLVGVEAASYGVPIVVAAGSGLGLYFKEKHEHMVAEKRAKHRRYLPYLIETYRKDAHTLLADKLFTLACDDEFAKLQGRITKELIHDCSWDNAARTFLSDLKLIPVENAHNNPTNLPIEVKEFAKKYVPSSVGLQPEFSKLPSVADVNKLHNQVEKHLIEISNIYHKLKEQAEQLPPQDTFKIATSDIQNLHRPLQDISNAIINTPRSALRLFRDHFTFYFELAFACLISAESQSSSRFNSLLTEMIILLNCAFGPEKAAFEASRPGVESLVWSLQSLSKDHSEKAFEFLKSLTKGNWPLEDAPTKAIMCQLLQAGLYVEIVDFLNLHDTIAARKHVASDLEEIETCVVSILSRKGGTGKSLISMLTSLSYLENHRNSKVCVIDMDLSGPSWQYLLFPEEHRPNRYLNECIDIEKLTEKTFKQYMEMSNLNELLETQNITEPPGEISLLTIRDLPRTNRILQEAILSSKENLERYTEFILNIIRSLNQQGYGLVIIDNAPGFGNIPLLSHSISKRVKYGQSLVVSTPYLPDIRGVLIDFSDEQILCGGEAPIWIINKITKEVEEYLSKGLTLYELASATKAYGTLLPERPILSRMQPKLDIPFRPLVLDEKFLSFATIKKAKTKPNQEIIQMIEMVTTSELMESFKKEVYPHLESVFSFEEQ